MKPRRNRLRVAGIGVAPPPLERGGRTEPRSGRSLRLRAIFPA